MEIKLYVSNFSMETTEEELRILFSKAGTIGSVNIITNRATGKSRGFAFINMKNKAGAEKAIRLFHTKTINDHALTVNITHPLEESPVGSGHYFSSGVIQRTSGGSSSG